MRISIKAPVTVSRLLRIWDEEGISCMPNGVWQFGRTQRESSPLIVPRGMRVAVRY